MRPRCAAGQWESDAARSVWVRVEGAGGTGATATLRRSGALGGRRALPVLGVLLALGVLALAGPRAAPLGPPEGLLAGRFGLALAFGVFVVSNLVGPIPVVLLGRDAPGLVAGTVAQHGALAVLSAWLLVRGRGGHWRAALGWGALPARTVVQAVATGVGLLAVAGLVTRFIDDPTATPMGQALEEVPVRYALALTALLAPVSEELFFRGLVYRCLEGRGAGRWARWMPVLGQGLLFAGAHAMQLQGALVGLVPILGVGLAAGFWRARTGGLAAPWVVHAVYNGTLVLSVFASA
jgi:membrane protease YdiL (CAAX protease family)